MEFRSEKIPRNRLGMVSVILRKKLLIPRHSEVYGRVNYEARNGRKWHEKNYFYKKFCSSKQNVFIPDSFARNSGNLLLFLFHETEFLVVFSSSERLRTEFASIFVLRNRIPSCFHFRGMVYNRIPRVCFFFHSMVQNSEHFFLCRTVQNGIPRVFCYSEQLEFRQNKPIVLSISSSMK
jgi:hypothetical protein